MNQVSVAYVPLKTAFFLSFFKLLSSNLLETKYLKFVIKGKEEYLSYSLL